MMSNLMSMLVESIHLRKMHRILGPRRGEGTPALKGSYGAVFRGGALGTQPGRRVLGGASHISPQFTTVHHNFPDVNNFPRNVGTCGLSPGRQRS
jgi:hypothetical protein